MFGVFGSGRGVHGIGGLGLRFTGNLIYLQFYGLFL